MLFGCVALYYQAAENPSSGRKLAHSRAWHQGRNEALSMGMDDTAAKEHGRAMAKKAVEEYLAEIE